ncbi:MAG: metallophosphoesterase [Eubacteriales bacterium]|nr:metallophosphoesterase [Eubacteriales bacterium]
MAHSGAWVAATAAVTTVICALRSRHERNHFKIEETVIASPKIRTARTLVFLSDLHDKEFGAGNEELLAAIRKINPDAVLIGGDMMVAKKGKAGLDVTRRLVQGLRNLGRPVYYANGNHEQRLERETEHYGNLYRELLEILQEQGVHYLSDASEELWEDVQISGLNLDTCYYRDIFPARMKTSYIHDHLGQSDARRFQILMVHSPLYHEAYAAWGADLALAGHFHGGTIRLPLLGGVMTPQYQFFLPCCAGTLERDGRVMVVSRGLGTHSINIRLNNYPQLVVVRLIPESGPGSNEKDNL